MVGSRTKIKVVKNKVAPPFKAAEVDIMFGEGISKEGSLIDLAAEVDIINKSGAWYSFESQRLGQGRENAKQFLKENQEIAKEIENRVRQYFSLSTKSTGEVAVVAGHDEDELSDLDME